MTNIKCDPDRDTWLFHHSAAPNHLQKLSLIQFPFSGMNRQPPPELQHPFQKLLKTH